MPSLEFRQRPVDFFRTPADVPWPGRKGSSSCLVSAAYPVILLTHIPMKTLEALRRFGKCLITLLGEVIWTAFC